MKYLIHTALLLITFIGNSQEIYRTTFGTLDILFFYNDSAVHATCKNVVVVLDYETAAFEIQIDKSKINTTIAIIDSSIQNKSFDFIYYKGKMGIEYIKTEKHPPMDFEVKGNLIYNNYSEELIGKGHLEHIYGDVYSCILNMSFNLTINNLSEKTGIEGLKDYLKIELIQSVLKPDK
ncbi:MAG: hypothetical protein Kow0079_08440 [Vicingaceae bacterium]